MGLLSKGDSGTAKQGAPSGSIKKYNYSQFVEEGRPSSAAVHTAAGYGSRVASSAALEMQLESSKRRANLGQLGADPRRKRSILCAPGRIWMHVLSLGQVAVAVGLIAVVAACLNRQQTTVLPADSAGKTLPVTYSVCYGTTRSTNICWYSYWAAAASIALSVTISLLQFCCPRRRQTMCLSFEALLGLLGAAWWIAAGVTDVVFSGEANSAGLPYATCRTVTWILCFVNAALFALSFISSTASCCAACGGYNDTDEDLEY